MAIEPGSEDEEYVLVEAVDFLNRRFTAVATRDHPDGSPIRAAVWPTPVLEEGYDLAFDVTAVGSPDPGSDLTVVIQT